MSRTESKAQLLIIEDDLTILRALALLLGKFGELDVASSTSEALARLRAKTFDVIISDYELPDGTGLDILDWLQQNRVESPYIMLTAHNSRELVIKTVNRHVFGFIEKPFLPTDLEEKVQAALDHGRQQAIVKAFASVGESSGRLVHEIANPMAVINCQIEALKDDGDTAELASSFARVLPSLEYSVERINRLIMATKANLRARSVSEEPLAVSLEAVLKDAKEEISFKAERAGVPLRYSVLQDLKVSIDGQKMIQVITNLVNNAIDAVSSLSERWVAIDALKEGDQARISITDSGAGIPEEVRSRLFTPLFTTKAGNGTGLGLSIVQQIVRDYGGAVTLNTDSPNTQFVVTLPLAR